MVKKKEIKHCKKKCSQINQMLVSFMKNKDFYYSIGAIVLITLIVLIVLWLT